MTQGNYDHPTYITRQMDNLGFTTAAANGTSLVSAYPMDMQIRRACAVVKTAGTSAGNFAYLMSLTGTVTTTLGTMTLGTGAANTVATMPDANSLLPTGSVVFVKNGTDATGVEVVCIEIHGNPLTGTWTTP